MNARAMNITIASGSTTSEVIPFLDGTTLGFITPSALTSTSFTFTVCTTPTGTFVPLYDSAGNQASINVSTDEGYTLTSSEADAIAPWPYVKLVGSGTEAAERTIIVQKK